MHPCQVDPTYYREHYPDLKALTDEQLLAHFHTLGKHEGRVGTRFALRENQSDLLNGASEALEIGPSLFPMIKGPGVKYFDLLSQEELRAARGYAIADLEPPYIDFVSPTGDLSIVTGTYDAVVSSHCIEHQPDLVQHLKDVGRLLKPGGKYVLYMPDKRYCFDHFIAESSLADVMQAHVEQRKVHTLASIVEHLALATHNDKERHWSGDHEDPGYRSGVAARAQNAVRQFVEANGAYIDVHAWQFTPDSFHFVVDRLAEMGLSPLKVDQVYCTTRNQSEFGAVLARA
ncbi:hypothetical protein CCR94_22815 [Rhodoblastus sphagnicola]|uniref:Methyltransferase type 11 domain-containing protein n=1 Tax=Rhodoblastus sphagnicola TaxID=333368 RepID=A0A2S6MVU4_9HYPH|nr:class I SAM-dependent methyltransferase [Rhodoblastus sphagnicola]MBB4198317.1 SAM-dependent methyltransferase [Rhodoblastus sphagnicola]PPQ26458.1 hypothetical protein CCR94_22815 [Rhodoblastus sphagnicola]